MQTTLLNSITLSEMTDLIRKTFVGVQQKAVPAASALFIKDPIGAGQGNTKRYDEYDTQTFARTKRQAEAVKKASVGIGYYVTMTKKRIGLEIDITQEMRDENRHAEVGTLITDLSTFCPQRIELDMTHRISFCTSTAYTDMDGDSVDVTTGDALALVSSAHLLKYSSSTYSNSVSGNPIFSRGGLEAAEQLATTNILSNFGEKRVIKFNTIVTGEDPNTVNTVKQFLASTADVDQNNSGVTNPYKGKYNHIVLPYLATTALGANDSTKARWWGLAAIGQGTRGFQAYFGEWEASHLNAPKDDNSNLVDAHRDIWTYGTRAGYGICAVSGRGLIMSCPTS